MTIIQEDVFEFGYVFMGTDKYTGKYFVLMVADSNTNGLTRRTIYKDTTVLSKAKRYFDLLSKFNFTTEPNENGLFIIDYMEVRNFNNRVGVDFHYFSTRLTNWSNGYSFEKKSRAAALRQSLPSPNIPSM